MKNLNQEEVYFRFSQEGLILHEKVFVVNILCQKDHPDKIGENTIFQSGHYYDLWLCRATDGRFNIPVVLATGFEENSPVRVVNENVFEPLVRARKLYQVVIDGIEYQQVQNLGGNICFRPADYIKQTIRMGVSYDCDYEMSFEKDLLVIKSEALDETAIYDFYYALLHNGKWRIPILLAAGKHKKPVYLGLRSEISETMVHKFGGREDIFIAPVWGWHNGNCSFEQAKEVLLSQL